MARQYDVIIIGGGNAGFGASADGRTALCDNFRRTNVLGGQSLRTWNQDKGQATAVACCGLASSLSSAPSSTARAASLSYSVCLCAPAADD